MLSKLPEQPSSDESDVETISDTFSEADEPLHYSDVEELLEDLSEDTEEGGEDDSERVLILCPFTLCGNCCSCGRVTEITVVSTSDAKDVVESLIETTRLNLVCDPCKEDLKRVRDGR